MAATARFWCPPAFRFVTVYAQVLMAADSCVSGGASNGPPQPCCHGSPLADAPGQSWTSPPDRPRTQPDQRFRATKAGHQERTLWDRVRTPIGDASHACSRIRPNGDSQGRVLMHHFIENALDLEISDATCTDPARRAAEVESCCAYSAARENARTPAIAPTLVHASPTIAVSFNAARRRAPPR